MPKLELVTQTLQAMTLPFTISLMAKDRAFAENKIAELIPHVQTELERLEEKFSAFRQTSLVSRFQAGDQRPIFDAEFQEVYAQVIALKKRSQGYFDPYFQGGYNPTGFVKGWLVEKLFKQWLQPMLSYPEIVAVAFNGGGDMQVKVRENEDFTWQIGIENPDNLQEFLAIYPLKEGALATSGLAKRGHHLEVRGEKDLLQVTVLSDSLAWADSWATALFSAGQEQAAQLIHQEKLTALLVTKDQLIAYQNGHHLENKQG
ncbi:FAD:protein FMN transferase, partial [Streptococcus sp. DD10]|uniref:FAD:protein FMN transferase n=1 Tax=Streptococcus sp. DD10 TaxID=1777878 RepID=UPI00082DB6FA